MNRILSRQMGSSNHHSHSHQHVSLYSSSSTTSSPETHVNMIIDELSSSPSIVGGQPQSDYSTHHQQHHHQHRNPLTNGMNPIVPGGTVTPPIPPLQPTSGNLIGSPFPPRYRFRDLLPGPDQYNTLADDGER